MWGKGTYSCVRTLAIATLMTGLHVGFAGAATTDTDINVANKTLPLLTNKLSGSVPTAIVFDPSNAASQAEADGINKTMGAGMAGPGGITLTPVMVPVSDLSKLSGAKIAILTGGLSGSYDKVFTAASSAGALSWSTDMGCVKANKCVLGIASSPSVEIYYSQAAADASKVSFGQAFQMLVKRI